jgi:exosortase
MSTPPEPPHRPQIPPAALWFGIIGCIAVIAFFYAIMPGFGPGREQAPLAVLKDSWNEETRYEHGIMFPFIIIGLLLYQWKQYVKNATLGDWKGLVFLVFGCLLFVIAYRVIQWRVAVGSLPFVVFGLVWYLAGRKTALLAAFPIFYLWLSIPLPDIQQATVPLQNISIKLAQGLCHLCSVETIAVGSNIYSPDSKWESVEVAESCSGIRSLMALLMISSAWAYIARMSLWKRSVLLLSAIPLSIIGNGFRVASIFVMAEYGNEKFAVGTWHDNSGLLIFYPISLVLMMTLHAMLEGWNPFKKKKVVRKVIASTQP